MIAVGVACGLLGAMLTLVAKPVPNPVALTPPSVMVPAEEFVGVAETTAPSETQPASEQFLFVFDAGGNKYLKLADLDQPGQIRWLPKLELVPKLNEDRLRYPDLDETVALGVVREADVPVEYRAWIGKQVRVEDVCKANITGFAVLARVAHFPELDAEREMWTAAKVVERGNLVFAARLDGCEVFGSFARDVALAPIIIPTPIENDALGAKARSAILASSAGKAAAAEWTADAQERDWCRSETDFYTHVVRHPKTGVTWIAIQSYAFKPKSCDGLDTNVLGLYRVDPQGSLVPVAERISAIRGLQLVDVDGDGNLEIFGRTDLETLLEQPDGTEIQIMRDRFFGD